MIVRLEYLEPRRLLSTVSAADIDPDDQIVEAINLGALSQTRSAQNSIDIGTDVDLFSFSVAAGQKITFDIEAVGADAAWAAGAA